jgi:hypothetical protein
MSLWRADKFIGHTVSSTSVVLRITVPEKELYFGRVCVKESACSALEHMVVSRVIVGV